jgi:hypothetical protein
MDVTAAMKEVAEQLDTISGLRVSWFPPEDVSAPGGWVSYPEAVNFHQTYGSGVTRIPNLPVVLVFGRATARVAAEKATAMASDAGVKAALEAGTYTEFDVLVVLDASFDIITLAGIDYVAVVFTIDIAKKN